MGCYDVFCTLCGGPLTQRDVLDSPDPRPRSMYWNYNAELLSDEKLKWLNELRIIGRRQNDPKKPKDAGADAEVYACTEFNDGGYFGAYDSNGNEHWCYSFDNNCQDGYRSFHFVLHSACLVVLEHALDQTDLSIDDFYEALCAQVHRNRLINSWVEIGISWNHGSYGAEQFWGQDWEAEKGWEFLLANPVEIPGMTEYILSHLHKIGTVQEKGRDQLSTTSPPKSPSTMTTNLPTLSRSPSLQTLIPEILTQITSYLSPTAVFSLRLCCKALTLRLPLNQRFWRDQLMSGNLLGLWDFDKEVIAAVEAKIEDPRANGDWRRLVRTLARWESFDAGGVGGRRSAAGGEGMEEGRGEMWDAPIGLRNRMRIWKIIHEAKPVRP